MPSRREWVYTVLNGLELLNEFSRIVLVLILDGFLIFEHTILSTFFYVRDGNGVDGCCWKNTSFRISKFQPFVALAGERFA